MKPEFSIIVPIYNVGEFLFECVDSVLNQAFKKFELILIDDGSIDDSPAICDRFAATDERIKVIHKENGGLSDARNHGIIESTGEFIVFLDGDDKLANDKVLNQLSLFFRSSESEIFYCPCYSRFFESDEFNYIQASKTESLTPSELFQYSISIKSVFAAWMFIVRADFLKNNRLYFTDRLIHEDMDWIPRLLMASNNKIDVFVKDFYLYRCNPNSITSSFNSARFDGIMYTLNWIAQRENNDKFLLEWFNMLVYKLLVDLEEELKFNKQSFKLHLLDLRRVMQQNIKKLTWRNKLVFVFSNVSICVFYKLRSVLK